MQPFCSTTTGCVGGSNVRSPNPSATNTTTFCRSPFESVMTSCENTGEGCCFAQLGSADMLIVFGFGIVPSNLTLPLRLAPVAQLAGAGLPAFTAYGFEMQIAAVRPSMDTNFFAFITTSPQSEFVVCSSFVSGREALFDSCSARSICFGNGLLVAAKVAGGEHGPVVFGEPASDGGTLRLTTFGREFA